VGPLNIGKFAMIGAGSVVTKDIPNHSLALGNPAKVVGIVNDNGIKTS
jgi:acetyltransferase-like isoleucine patch superfamily enzyme